MESLVDRAAQSLARHPAPALPLEELLAQLRGGGGAVGAEVLLRALEGRPDLFRVLDPFRGPWRALTGPERARGGPAARGERWVVGLADGGGGEPGAAARLKASLRHLGRTVDDRSAIDLVRWLGMVREGERLRPARWSA